MNRKCIPLLVLIAMVLPSWLFSQSFFTKEIKENWQFAAQHSDNFRAANVPGSVQMDLYSLGELPDPFFGKNETLYQWIGKENWKYRTQFSISESEFSHPSITLEFKGLDTYAVVVLNGDTILSASNMFLGHTLPVKEKLKIGTNLLEVHFKSPIQEALPAYQASAYELPAGNDQSDQRVSVYTRKAPYHYGWDWGPRFVTMGIWQPVFLNFNAAVQITEQNIQTSNLTNNVAKVAGHIELHALAPQKVYLEIKMKEEVVVSKEIMLQQGGNKIPVTWQVENPTLWWPNGWGVSHLYSVSTTVTDKKGGIIQDKEKLRLGIRTIEVINAPDSIGESFYVKVNGQSMFMKGANYIPQDNFLSRVDSIKYNELLQDMVEANMNMVRVWGGGIYEKEVFYDLCDEKGILVWQDFMFACAMYPGDATFLNSVKKEATYAIKRLRNHASLALWCGNNEINVAWHNWGWQNAFGYTKKDSSAIWHNYLQLFDHVLPEVVSEFDPERFYFPSSPISNWGKMEDFNFGDNHYWGVWHGEHPFENYNTFVARFNSEFGFQSFPEKSTVSRYTTEKDWSIESEVMMAHQRHPKGNQLIKSYMGKNYGQAKNFDAFLYLSQVQQAEGVAIALRAHRRNMPFSMGSLYWQLNDCWPVASWSSIDYFGNWKALHYFAKHAFAPAMLSFYSVDNGVELHLINDKSNFKEAKVTLALYALDGENTQLLWNANTEVLTNSATKLWQEQNKKILKRKQERTHFLVAKLMVGEQEHARAIHYFKPVKDLTLKNNALEFKTVEESGKMYIVVSSSVLAKNVYFYQEEGPLSLSDNYFDLLPGETRKIEILNPKGVGKVKVWTVAKALAN